MRLHCSIRGSELRYSTLRAPRTFLSQCSVRLASSSVLSHVLTCPESSGSSAPPVKRQTPETPHLSVRSVRLGCLPSISRALRFCVLFAELYPCVEHTLRCAGCNRFARISQSLSEAGLKAFAVDRAVRDQYQPQRSSPQRREWRVAGSSGTRPPRQNCTENTRIVLRVAASQLLQRCVLQTVLGRVKTVFGQLAVDSLPQAARGGDGQLIHRHHRGKSGRDRRAPRKREPSSQPSPG